MLQCKATEIKKYHTFLKGEFAPHLSDTCSIDRRPAERNSKKWEALGYEGFAIFQLWPETAVYSQNPQRYRSPVAQLAQVAVDAAERYWWVSWEEQWHKSRKDPHFCLRHAGLTFYRGRPMAVDQVLFRAEWPDETAALKSGHPHWHVDLVESGLSISGIHLAMSGWSSGDGNFPACWQAYPTDCKDLLSWAGRTLEYVRSELIQYPPKIEHADSLESTGDEMSEEVSAAGESESPNT